MSWICEASPQPPSTSASRTAAWHSGIESDNPHYLDLEFQKSMCQWAIPGSDLPMAAWSRNMCEDYVTAAHDDMLIPTDNPTSACARIRTYNRSSNLPLQHCSGQRTPRLIRLSFFVIRCPSPPLKRWLISKHERHDYSIATNIPKNFSSSEYLILVLLW